jgi:hypothetical protein
MPDREKAIRILEGNYKNFVLRHNGELLTVNELIALLKAQEPRVMTLEEIREGEVCWFDCPGNFILRPVICNMYDRGDSSYLNFIWQHGNFSWKICEYGRTWRCWTSRPTDAQREATPWEP